MQAPDINVSDKDFTPIYVKETGTIRFGLMAVRGVGEKAVEAIMAERARGGAFTSLYDFCERVDMRQVTRSTIEALIKCGAFSSMKAKRASASGDSRPGRRDGPAIAAGQTHGPVEHVRRG